MLNDQCHCRLGIIETSGNSSYFIIKVDDERYVNDQMEFSMK